MKCPDCKKNTLKFQPWVGLIYQCYNPKCNYRGPIVLDKKKSIRIAER